MRLWAVLSLLAISVVAAPTVLSRPELNLATIVNRCPFPVYLWSVAGGQIGFTPTVTLNAYDIQSGASSIYSETLHQSPDGSGISIKIAHSPDLSRVTGTEIEQLEYALNFVMGTVFYDLSEINGGPFAAKGQQVELSVGPSCPTVHSNTAYHRPDDVATKACKMPANLILTLCAS